jgi:hypothetical protein
MLDQNALTKNNLGGKVLNDGLALYGFCGTAFRCLNPNPPRNDPHFIALGRLKVGWKGAGAYYVNNIPAKSGNIKRFRSLQFRVAVNFADVRNPRLIPQDFSVALVDSGNRVRKVPVSRYSRSLFYPPGRRGLALKAVMNTARIPITAFKGIDLQNIRRVVFDFDEKTSGGLLVSDIAFAK